MTEVDFYWQVGMMTLCSFLVAFPFLLYAMISLTKRPIISVFTVFGGIFLGLFLGSYVGLHICQYYGHLPNMTLRF